MLLATELEHERHLTHGVVLALLIQLAQIHLKSRETDSAESGASGNVERSQFRPNGTNVVDNTGVAENNAVNGRVSEESTPNRSPICRPLSSRIACHLACLCKGRLSQSRLDN